MSYPSRDVPMKLRAVTVCVDYAEYLAVTLPLNLAHCSDYLVVTAKRDEETKRVCRGLGVDWVATDVLYEHGAKFNKYAALEEGLSCLGRHGWLCHLDADVVLPNAVDDWTPESCHVHVPWRRMHTAWAPGDDVPDEVMWVLCPRHRVTTCHSGYCQVYHANDPVLATRGVPWHEVDWAHAGGGDTAFSELWPAERRARPSWEVLHLGDEVNVNWCGRSDDGRRALADMMRLRRSGKSGRSNGYAPERVKPD